MPVLSDTQIRELVYIEPFASNEKRPGVVSFGVSSYGYDVRVGTKFKIFTNATSGGTAVVDPKNFTNDLFLTIDTAETGRDHIIIPPNSFALAETVEEILVKRHLHKGLDPSGDYFR
jgi:dCTP deaminase